MRQRHERNFTEFAFVFVFLVQAAKALDSDGGHRTPEFASDDEEFVQHLASTWFYTHEQSRDILSYTSDSLTELADRLEHGLDADGLEIVMHPVLNRTLRAVRPFEPRSYVCEYVGEVIDDHEAGRRVAATPKDTFGYMLSYRNLVSEEVVNVDASAEDGRHCRLANHSWKQANVDVFPINYKNRTRIIFLTTREVAPGDELIFDYGHWATNENDLKQFPWLAE